MSEGKKVDITISPSMTINTGDYESIKPAVSLTVKGVQAYKIDSVYKTMSKICQEMFMMEVTLLASKRMDIKNMGLNSFVATWLQERNEDDFEELKKELEEMLWEI
jgi:hypothetical protein